MSTISIFIVIGLVFYSLTCLALVDVALKDFGSTGRKAMWGIIAFIPFIGFLIYVLFGYRKGKRKFSI